MVEVDLLYELMPAVDQKAYQEWAKRTIGLVLKSPGVIEFRAYRNILGSPFVRSTSVWKTLADWSNFVESAGWKAAEAELRAKYGVDIRVELWGPSPVVPEPLRPGK
jgi:heme-degrading monooxygenase HmoA